MNQTDDRDFAEEAENSRAMQDERRHDRGLCPTSKKPGVCSCPTSESWCRKMTNFSSDEFTWRSNDRSGAAEASDLGFRPGPLPQNIWVKSTKTGATVRFEQHGVIQNREGELQWTQYIAVANGLFVEIVIYND